MKRFKTLAFAISILMMAISSFAKAETTLLPVCSERDQLLKWRDYYQAQAQVAQKASVAFDKIELDHKTIHRISSGLAVTSGIALAILTKQGMKTYGGMDEFLYQISFRINPVMKAYYQSVAWRIVSAAGGPILLVAGGPLLAPISLPLLVLLPTISIFEVSYPVAMGTYQLLTDHGKIEVRAADITDGEEGIRASLLKISDLKKNLLLNPPSAIKDSLTFGGANSDYYSKLALLTKAEVQHWQILASLKDLQFKMLDVSCDK